MSRGRTLFFTILPTAIASGFLFASAFGHAETGTGGALGFWPAASDSATGAVVVAQADPRPSPPRYRGGPVPPVPPAPPPAPTVVPSPPAPPAPPSPPHRGRSGHGFSVKIHGDKIEIEGIAELVENQLESVLNTIDHLPDVPPDVRSRVKARIQGVRGKINARLGRLRSMDLDKLDRLGPEMERMGDEIEKEMEGLDKDLAQLGDKLGKSFSQKFAKDFAKDYGKDYAKNFGPKAGHDSDDDDDDNGGDDDDKDAVVATPGVDIDIDPSTLAPMVAALKGAVTLDPHQKQQIAQLRKTSDEQIAGARRELEQMSGRLQDTLRDSSASEADIARQIDAISQKEATIRKARILTWVKARNVLRADQRKKVEAVVKSH